MDEMEIVIEKLELSINFLDSFFVRQAKQRTENEDKLAKLDKLIETVTKMLQANNAILHMQFDSLSILEVNKENEIIETTCILKQKLSKLEEAVDVLTKMLTEAQDSIIAIHTKE